MSTSAGDETGAKVSEATGQPVVAAPVAGVGYTPEARREPDPESQQGSSKPDAPRQGIRPLDIRVPREIGRYSIGTRIGSGTCGVVHLALDNALRREVAIKLSPVGEVHVTTGKVPGAQRAYQTELVAAGRLRHPNIVTVYDAGRQGELNYLIMEAINGQSLKAWGKGKALLPVSKALQVAIDCSRALSCSHEQKILHRDIKPANIMLADNGAVKLLDFGIAVGLDPEAGLSIKGPTLGTPNYMSPEQILGRELGSASDQYSLATVLFELLTGRQLFKAGKVKDLFRAVVRSPAPRLREFRPDLPLVLDAILARALLKDPALRYDSCEQFAQALQPLADGYRIIEERSPEERALMVELSALSFFANFSEEEIARLLVLARRRSYGPGDLVVSGDSPPRELTLVTDGVLYVCENTAFKRACGPGDCVGEERFLQNAPGELEAMALTDVSVLHFDNETLSQMPPATHLHYYRTISERLAHSQTQAAGVQIDLVL